MQGLHAQLRRLLGLEAREPVVAEPSQVGDGAKGLLSARRPALEFVDVEWRQALSGHSAMVASCGPAGGQVSSSIGSRTPRCSATCTARS